MYISIFIKSVLISDGIDLIGVLNYVSTGNNRFLNYIQVTGLPGTFVRVIQT